MTHLRPPALSAGSRVRRVCGVSRRGWHLTLDLLVLPQGDLADAGRRPVRGHFLTRLLGSAGCRPDELPFFLHGALAPYSSRICAGRKPSSGRS